MKAANDSLFFAAVAALSVFLAAGVISPASAKLKMVYSFCSEADCSDGENPQAFCSITPGMSFTVRQPSVGRWVKELYFP